MDACPIPQAVEPCALVIFGASGDLTKRKLVPSLYNLASYRLLPADFSIIGVARRPLPDEVFREQLGKALAELGTQRCALCRPWSNASPGRRASRDIVLCRLQP